MKNLLRALRFCLLALFIATGVSLHAASTDALGTPAGSIAVPANLTGEEIQQALIKAADGRGWTLVARDDEMVVVRLEKSDWSSRVTLLYNTREVQYFSNSLRKGKPKLPVGWIKNLKDDATRIMTATSVLKN
jgi:hypothetical protein